MGGALPLNLPEHILKLTPLQLPEGTHQRDPREAEEDLKGPAPGEDLEGNAECVESVTSRDHAHMRGKSSILIVVKGNAPLAGLGLVLAMALAMTLAKLKA